MKSRPILICQWPARSALAALGLAAFVALASAQPARVNLAKYQPAAASSAAAADPALYATDGIVGNGNRWKSDGTPPHTLTVTLPFAFTLGSAQLFLGRDDTEPVASFSLQCWNDSTWVNIPGATVSGNTRTVLNLVFTSPVTTSRVRFYSTESVVRVRELALYPTNGPAGFPIGTDVTLNLARKRAASASSTEDPNYPKGAVDGYVDDSGRWKGAAVAGPHTLTIELEEASRLGSAHVYSGSTTTGPISDFTLRYYDGTNWLDIPGGAVTGNTNYERRVKFTTPVSSSRVRLYMPGSGTTAMRVRELAVFAAQSGLPDDYPIGTDVLFAAKPTTLYDRRADDYWQIRNREQARALVAAVSGAGLAGATPPPTAQHFQLLYNLDSDTYRLRMRDTFHCLAAQDAGTAPGTAVVEQNDYQAMPHELWRFEDMGGGYYRIRNVWNGLALEASAAEPSVVTLQAPGASLRQQWDLPWAGTTRKKGQGGWDGDHAKFRSSWLYNWDRVTGTALPAGVTFSPMQHNRWWPGWDTLYQSRPGWLTSSQAAWMLGFNEPDHTDQANMTTDEAIALWPQLEQTDIPLVSPAAAKAFGGWLADFYTKANARGFRVDYTAVHWYANPNAGSLISHLQSVKDTFGGRAVLLTEFSTVDWAGTANWTEEDNYRFLAEFLWRAEAFSWIKRYAIFIFSGDPPANPWTRGSGGVRGNLLRSDNATLTAFGELYSAWDGDTTLRDRKPYLVHNKAAAHRLRKSTTTTAPDKGTIRQSDVPLQFVLLPAATAGRWHLVSLRDGTRLRYLGATLEFARPGTRGSDAEWSSSVADGTWGYFHLDHPATGTRLKLNRTDDANGAPTSVTYSLAANTDTTDGARWRFIVPYQVAETNPPAAPASLTASSGMNRLTWTASTNADVLWYSVYRSATPGGPYARLATGLASPSYADAATTPGTTYYYRVTASDWMENESGYSPEAGATAGHNAAADFIPAGSVWKYFAQSNDLGTAWRSPAFNDAAWPNGPAMLGFGDANGLLPATLVASNRQWTTYFRHTFFVPAPDLVLALTARVLRDDAAVVYLNGTEVWHDANLPSGLITHATPALTGLSDAAESTWLTTALNPGPLVPGTNLLAIEVHQNALTSSDLALDFALAARVSVPANTRLNLTLYGDALVLTWPLDASYLRPACTTNLTPPVAWVPLTNTPSCVSGAWRLALPAPAAGSLFYRLQWP